MPRIDLAPAGDMVQGLVHGPDINVGDMGKGFAAEGQVGGEVANLAFNAAAMRKQSNDTNYAFKTTMDDQKAIEDYGSKLQQTLPPGATGYAEQMQTFIQERVDQNTGNAPSQEAADLYSKSIGRYAADRVISANQYEKTETANQNRQNVIDETSSATQRFMSNPNYLTFDDVASTITDRIQKGSGVDFQASEVPDLVKKARQQLAVGVMEGLKNSPDDRNNEAMMILQPGHTVGDALSDDQKKHYLDQFSNLITSKQQSGAKELVEYGKSLKDAIIDPNRHVTNADVNNYLFKLKSNPAVSQDQYQKEATALKNSMQVGNDIKLITTLPRDKWDQVKSNQPDQGPISGLHDRLETQRIFQTAKEELIKSQNKEGAEAATTSDPQLSQLHKEAQGLDPAKVQAYNSALKARQSYLGIPQKLTMPQDREIISNAINKAPNPAASAETIMSLQKSYGQDYPKLFGELADSKANGGHGIDGNLMVAGFMSNKASAEKIISNTANYQSINQAFDASNKSGLNGTTKNINSNVAAATKDISETLARGSFEGANGILAKSIVHQVTINAMDMMNKDKNLTSKDAVDQSYKQIVSDNFTVMNGGNSKIIVPSKIGDVVPIQKNIEGAMSFYSTKDGLKELGLKTPDKTPSMDKGQVADQYYQTLAKTSRWVTTSDKSGIKLVQDTSAGFRAVPNKDGNPIVLNFRDLNQGLPKSVQDHMSSAYSPSLGFSF